METATLVFGILTLIVAIIACIFAYCIPKRIMLNQLFADLVAEYRTPEMGEAILALFHFYDKYVKTGEDFNSEYKNLYDEQIQKQLDDGKGKKVDFANTLHFQRRLVTQFYLDMADLYVEQSRHSLLIKKINNWFSDNELNLLKIILLLVQPASNVFIQVGNVPEPPSSNTQIEKSIRSLYEEVSKHITELKS